MMGRFRRMAGPMEFDATEVQNCFEFDTAGCDEITVQASWTARGDTISLVVTVECSIDGKYWSTPYFITDGTTPSAGTLTLAVGADTVFQRRYDGRNLVKFRARISIATDAGSRPPPRVLITMLGEGIDAPPYQLNKA